MAKRNVIQKDTTETDKSQISTSVETPIIIVEENKPVPTIIEETPIVKLVETPIQRKVEVKKPERIIEPKIIKVEEKKEGKTFKTIYESYLSSGFKILKEGNIIYDSSVDNNNSIKFEDEYFTLFGKKYSYQGSRFIKK